MLKIIVMLLGWNKKIIFIKPWYSNRSLGKILGLDYLDLDYVVPNIHSTLPIISVGR